MLDLFEPMDAEEMLGVRQREAGVMDVRATADLYYKGGPAYTLSDDIGPYACAGLLFLWNGVAEAWMLTSERAANHKMAMYRTCKRLFNAETQRLNLHRVQCVVLPDNFVSMKWLTRMGFLYEGDVPQYGPDRADFIRMAWVKGRAPVVKH